MAALAADKPSLAPGRGKGKFKRIAIEAFCREVESVDNTRIILFSLIAFLALSVAVRADIAPPQISMNVTYEGYPVNGTFYADILTCSNSSDINATQVPTLELNESYDADKGCYWIFAENMEEMTCEDSWCRFYYFPQADFKALFYLPDLNETFITNEIDGSNFAFSYAAQLYADGSATLIPFVTPPTPSWDVYALFACALLLTLAVELAVAFLYLNLAKVKKMKRILITAAVANIISVPVLWFGFVLLLGGLGFLLGEIFAVVFEGAFIYYFNRNNKKTMGLKSAMIMSLAMNAASLAVGAIVVVSLAL